MQKNKKILFIVGGILILLAVFVAILIMSNQGHRIISVEDVAENVSLNRNNKDIIMTNGMNLINKDYIALSKDGEEFVNLLIDDDKHVSAFDGAEFEIVAVGNPDKGKIAINQKDGKIVCAIDKKLTDKSYFEVNTPNSCLSVRGTTFESNYDSFLNKTDLRVDEGIVNVKTANSEKDVNAGESITVIGEDIFKNNATRIHIGVGFEDPTLFSHNFFITKYNGDPLSLHIFDELYQIYNAKSPWRVIYEDKNLDKILKRFKEIDNDNINPNRKLYESYYDKYQELYKNGTYNIKPENIDIGMEYFIFYNDNNEEIKIPILNTTIEPWISSYSVSGSEEPSLPYYINEYDEYIYVIGVSLYFDISPEYYDLLSDTFHLDYYEQY